MLIEPIRRIRRVRRIRSFKESWRVRSGSISRQTLWSMAESRSGLLATKRPEWRRILGRSEQSWACRAWWWRRRCGGGGIVILLMQRFNRAVISIVSSCTPSSNTISLYPRQGFRREQIAEAERLIGSSESVKVLAEGAVGRVRTRQ